MSKFPYIKIKKISATTPQDITKYKINKSIYCNYNTELEFACTISHLNAIFTAYKNIYNMSENIPKYALITEDDLVILEMPKWKELIESAPKDWEILQLVAVGPAAEDMYRNTSLNKWAKYDGYTYSAVAYLMNIKGMNKILKLCVPEYTDTDNWDDINIINLDHNVFCSIDHLIYSITNTYTYTKPIFSFEGIDSTIHPDHLPYHHATMDVIHSQFLKNKNN
jgi:GR25 family glycosyltransferase involved in LPS biosynthesis